jgi:hypothetical protein
MRLFIGILFFVVAIFVSVALVPPYWANYQFEDAIKTEALMATNSTKTEDAIRDSVYKRAQDFGVPLEKEKIKVTHLGANGSGSVTIEAPYSVTVNIPGYPIVLHFDPMTTNKGVF